MNDDKRAVDELVEDIREELQRGLAGMEMLRAGVTAEDDLEGEGLAAITDPAETERLARLRSVLQAALADLP